MSVVSKMVGYSGVKSGFRASGSRSHSLGRATAQLPPLKAMTRSPNPAPKNQVVNTNQKVVANNQTASLDRRLVRAGGEEARWRR